MIVSCPKLLENCNSTLDVSRIQYSKFYKFLIFSTTKYINKWISNNQGKSFKMKFNFIRYSANPYNPVAILLYCSLPLSPFLSWHELPNSCPSFLTYHYPTLTTLPSLLLAALLCAAGLFYSVSFTLLYSNNSINSKL